MVKRRGFTLVELLIVIALLGAIATVVLAQMRVNRKKVVDDSLVPAEMNEICRAYADFEADCVPTNDDKDLIGKYGLEILMLYKTETGPPPDPNPRGWSFPASFDSDRGKGWRGPYLQSEDKANVDVSASGQPLDSSGTEIPVIHDPRHSMDKGIASQSELNQHYYRVLCHPTKYHLALVYVGANDTLETAVVPDGSLPSDPTFNDCFTVAGDDVIRPLSSMTSP